MMFQAILSNPSHPEYGVATIPFPIPRDQYAHCMELLEALEIGDAVKADCKVEKIDSFYAVLKRAEMLAVNVEELNYLAKRLESFDNHGSVQCEKRPSTSLLPTFWYKKSHNPKSKNCGVQLSLYFLVRFFPGLKSRMCPSTTRAYRLILIFRR